MIGVEAQPFERRQPAGGAQYAFTPLLLGFTFAFLSDGVSGSVVENDRSYLRQLVVVALKEILQSVSGGELESCNPQKRLQSFIVNELIHGQDIRGSVSITKLSLEATAEEVVQLDNVFQRY